jgi:hypothetical protein
VYSRGYQSGDMRHIYKQVSANTVGYLAEFLEIYCPRISRCPRQDHPWLMGFCQLGDSVVIQRLGLPVHAVTYHLKEPAGKIMRVAVGKVPAGSQIHGQHRIPGL